MTTAILETDAEIAERLLELAAAGVEDDVMQIRSFRRSREPAWSTHL